MAILDWFCNNVSIDLHKFTKQERYILETEMLLRIYQEIWSNYKTIYKEYFSIQINSNKDESVMELYIIRFLINELINKKAYTLAGIAYYTNMPEEVIEDLFMGHKVSAMLAFPRKLIELHKMDQPDIYQNVLKKLIAEKEKEQHTTNNP